MSTGYCHWQLYPFVLLTSLCAPAVGIRTLRALNSAGNESCTKPSYDFRNRNRCPAGWTLSNHGPLSCLWFLRQRKTFAESRAFCQKRWADIPTPNSEDVLSALRVFFMDQGETTFWLAVNDRDRDGKWTWDGGSVSLSAWDLIGYWKYDKERLPEGRQYPCAIQKWHWWYAEPCENVHAVVCQVKINTNATCPEGFTRIYETGCVRLFDDKLNYAQARKKCENLKMHLPFSYIYEIHKGVANLVARHERVWIGITRQQTEDWQWINGVNVAAEYQKNWKGSVVPTGPKETCAFHDYYKWWHAADCEETSYTICMSEVIDGPRDTLLEAQYHRSDKVFFVGEEATITCTAIGAHQGIIRWTAGDREREVLINETYVTNTLEFMTSKEGVCINRTTSTLTHPNMQELQDLQLSCFAWPIANTTRCVKYNDAISYCDSIPNVSIIERRYRHETSPFVDPFFVMLITILTSAIITAIFGTLAMALRRNKNEGDGDETTLSPSYAFDRLYHSGEKMYSTAKKVKNVVSAPIRNIPTGNFKNIARTISAHKTPH